MTTRSLFGVEPVIVPASLLLVVLVSVMRFTELTVAVTVCAPAVATQ